MLFLRKVDTRAAPKWIRIHNVRIIRPQQRRGRSMEGIMALDYLRTN